MEDSIEFSMQPSLLNPCISRHSWRSLNDLYDKHNIEMLKKFLCVEVPLTTPYKEIIELIENTYGTKHTNVWKIAYEALVKKMKITGDYSKVYSLLEKKFHACPKLTKLANKIINKAKKKMHYLESFRDCMEKVTEYVLNGEILDKHILKTMLECSQNKYAIICKAHITFDLEEICDLKTTYEEFYYIRNGVVKTVFKHISQYAPKNHEPPLDRTYIEDLSQVLKEATGLEISAFLNTNCGIDIDVEDYTVITSNDIDWQSINEWIITSAHDVDAVERSRAIISS